MCSFTCYWNIDSEHTLDLLTVILIDMRWFMQRV